ncbi:MAG: ABC transporter substrate-binding protein [Terricaulis sp.]
MTTRIQRRTLLSGFASAALASCTRGAGSREGITVVSYGAGTYQESHRNAFLTPFTEQTQIATTSAVWNAEYGRLRTMVETGDVGWDVVDVTAAQLARGKRDGILERINPLPETAGFLPGTIDEFGVGNVYWATVLAFDSNASGPKPQSWADFFDIRSFPGARALYDDPRANIEFALLASGVPKAELYPLTDDKVAEAFRRLSRIRDEVRVWWSDGSQPVQLLMTGQVAMSSAWNGRIFASPEAAARLRYPWNGAALELDYWVIPRGSRHASEAAQFISFASNPDRVATQVAAIGYGPANTNTLELLPENVRSSLPTYAQNFNVAFVVDPASWEEREDELRTRWVSWRTTGRP